MEYNLSAMSAENIILLVFVRMDTHFVIQVGDGYGVRPISLSVEGLKASNAIKSSGSITMDTRWYLDGTYKIDGTRHLDAGIRTEAF
jgi:hypothetical protein